MVEQDLNNLKSSSGAVSGVSTANLQTMKDDLAKALSAAAKKPLPASAPAKAGVRPTAPSLPADSGVSGKSPALNPIFGIGRDKNSSWGFMKSKVAPDKTVKDTPPASLPVSLTDKEPASTAKLSSALADLRSKITSLKTSPSVSPLSPASPASLPAASTLSPIAPPRPIIPPRPVPPLPPPVEPVASPPPPPISAPRPTPPASATPKPALPVPSVARPSVPPHEPELPSIDIDEEEEGGWSRKKLILVALGGVIIVVGGVSFVLTGGSEVSKEPTTPPVETPVAVYQEKDPLFSRAVLNLRASVSEQDFFDDLAAFSVSSASGEFTKIIVSGADNKPLSFEQFLDYSGIFLPAGALESAPEAVFADDFTFYSYKGERAFNFTVAVPLAGGVSEQDAGRFMSAWEATFADDWFFLLKGRAGAASTIEFQNSARLDVPIRYKNFPTPDLAIDYAIAPDYLLISSSRESMYAAIDALVR